LEDHGMFCPAFALGYAAAPAIPIPTGGLTAKRLARQAHAFVRFDDPDSWVHLADTGEQAALTALRAELVLPLTFNDQMLGIMSLGPKRSEEPFSSTDIKLLDSVAAQTGMALENARLTDAVKAEVAEREKQKRELEIAHEVQERLFPQECPPVAGLEYA